MTHKILFFLFFMYSFSSDSLFCHPDTLAVQNVFFPISKTKKPLESTSFLIEKESPKPLHQKSCQRDKNFQEEEILEFIDALFLEIELIRHFSNQFETLHLSEHFKIETEIHDSWKNLKKDKKRKFLKNIDLHPSGVFSFSIKSKWADNLSVNTRVEFSTKELPKLSRQLSVKINISSESETQMHFFFNLIACRFGFQSDCPENNEASKLSPSPFSPELDIKTVNETLDSSLAEKYLEDKLSLDEHGNFISHLAFLISSQYFPSSAKKPTALFPIFKVFSKESVLFLELHLKNILRLERTLSKKLNKPVKFYIYIFTGSRSGLFLLKWIESHGFSSPYIRFYSQLSLNKKFLDSPEELRKICLEEKICDESTFQNYQKDYENLMESNGSSYGQAIEISFECFDFDSSISEQNDALGSALRSGVFREMKANAIECVHQFDVQNILGVPKMKTLLNQMLQSEKNAPCSAVCEVNRNSMKKLSKPERNVVSFFKDPSSQKIFCKKTPYPIKEELSELEYVGLGNYLYKIDTIQNPTTFSPYFQNTRKTSFLRMYGPVLLKQNQTQDISFFFTAKNPPIFIETSQFILQKLRNSKHICLDFKDCFFENLSKTSTAHHLQTLFPQLLPLFDRYNPSDRKALTENFKKSFFKNLSKFLKSEKSSINILLSVAEVYQSSDNQETLDLSLLSLFAKLKAINTAFAICPHLHFNIILPFDSQTEQSTFVTNISKHIFLPPLSVDWSLKKEKTEMYFESSSAELYS